MNKIFLIVYAVSFNIISATARKRFYKNVDIASAGNGIFEVTLDSKKVKTPNGAVLTVENEGLALAVAHEWQAQDEVVQVYFFLSFESCLKFLSHQLNFYALKLMIDNFRHGKLLALRQCR